MSYADEEQIREWIENGPAKLNLVTRNFQPPHLLHGIAARHMVMCYINARYVTEILGESPIPKKPHFGKTPEGPA